MRRAPRRLVAFLSVVLAILYFAVTMLVGPRTGNDTWTYAAWGEVLLANNWNLAAFRDQVDFLGGTEILHIAATSVFAILTAVFQDGWITGYLVFNWLTLSATSVIILLSLRKLELGRSALVLVALILGVIWEHVYWVAVIYTDISFNLILGGVLALYVAGLTARTDQRRRIALTGAFLLALLSISYRPTGLWLVGALAVAFIAGVHRIPAHAGSPRTYIIRAFGLGLLVVLTMWIGASIVLANANQLYPPFFKEMVLHAHQYFQGGVVVRARPETFSAPPEGVVDFAFLIAKKFLYFFKFSAEGFGFWHNVYNWLTFVPFYSLALLGAAALAFPSSRMTAAMRAIGLMSLIWIVTFAAAHAATIIDFDWRYRLPTYAPMAVLAAIGFDLARRSMPDWIAKVRGRSLKRFSARKASP